MSADPHPNLGRDMRRKMRELGLTQADLAKRAGVGRDVVKRWLRVLDGCEEEHVQGLDIELFATLAGVVRAHIKLAGRGVSMERLRRV